MADVRVEHPFSAPRAILSLAGLVPLVAIAMLVVGRPYLGILIGCALFLTYPLVIVPWTFLAAHRRGVREVRARRIEWALEAFRDSESFFRAHPWLDRGRWFFFASGLPISYQALARYDQVYCLAELGRKSEAEALLASLKGEAIPNLAQLERYVSTIRSGPRPSGNLSPLSPSPSAASRHLPRRWRGRNEGGHGHREPEVLQHRLVPFVILLPIGRPDAATNPGGLSVAPRPPDEPVWRGHLHVEQHRGATVRRGLEPLDLEPAERRFDGFRRGRAPNRRRAKSRGLVLEPRVENPVQDGNGPLATGRHEVPGQPPHEDRERIPIDSARRDRHLLLPVGLAVEVAVERPFEPVRPELELLVHVAAPLLGAHRHLRRDPERQASVEYQEGRGQEVVVVDARLEVAHLVELQHGKLVVVPAVRLHALCLREGLGHVHEHRGSVAELAVARLRERVRVDLRAPVAPGHPRIRQVPASAASARPRRSRPSHTRQS